MYLGGISTQAVADAIDLRRETVAYWKSGRSTPKITDLENAFAFLDLEIKVGKKE
jgi:transcriptional regulator with XRE-family HTH domain